jgi:hypothetical protein
VRRITYDLSKRRNGGLFFSLNFLHGSNNIMDEIVTNIAMHDKIIIINKKEKVQTRQKKK